MAEASDFFKQLSAGIRFDRKRPESRVARAHPANQSNPASQAHVIDFFNETVRQSDSEGRGPIQASSSGPRSSISDEETEKNPLVGDISVFRKAMRINVKGEDVADVFFSFHPSFLAESVGQAMDAFEHRGHAMEGAYPNPDAGYSVSTSYA